MGFSVYVIMGANVVERVRMMPTAQINPKLIQLLNPEKKLDVPESPTQRFLPGKYVKAIFQQSEMFHNYIFDKNDQMLTCKSCGRKGKYDIGQICYDGNPTKVKDSSASDQIQCTGYFRCKHCNAAGNWELPKTIYINMMANMLTSIGGTSNKIHYGKIALFDGSSHPYGTDCEEHLLHAIEEAPQNAFLWNRLGNVYQKGKRQELAMCAFEHSIKLDPHQIESHYSIGDLLFHISDLKNASYHFKQALIHAHLYQHIPAEPLRELLSIALFNLFTMHLETEGDISFLPTEDEIKSAEKKEENPIGLMDMDLEISLNDLESFYPLAEIFMRQRAREIPLRKRTFNVPNISSLPSKNKKKKRKKRK